MGEAASQIRLVSSVADAEAVEVRGPRARRLHHPDDAFGRGHAADRRGAEAPLSEDPVAGQGRHLLRHAEPPARGPRARQAMRRVILVVGSRNSSNSNRLVEEAQLAGARAYLVDDVSEIDPSWLDGVETVGFTSGASAPEFLVDEIVRVPAGSGGAREVREVLTVDGGRFLSASSGGQRGRARASRPPEAARRMPSAAERPWRPGCGWTARSRSSPAPRAESARRSRGGSRPEGARVVLAARDRAACERIADEIVAVGEARRSRSLRRDARGLRLHARSRRRSRSWGRIDVLVNNAGVGGPTPLDDPDDSRWNAILATNLTAVFRVTREASPFLPQGGRVINLSSVLGRFGVAGPRRLLRVQARRHRADACARAGARAAQDHRQRDLPRLGRDGDGARRLSPIGRRARTRGRRDRRREMAPLGRVLDPEEVAGLAAYLASDDARFRHGPGHRHRRRTGDAVSDADSGLRECEVLMMSARWTLLPTSSTSQEADDDARRVPRPPSTP